jgi:transposase
VRWIRSLLDQQDRDDRRARASEDEVYLAVAELLDRESVSVRSLAEALDVPPSTVQGWAKRGRILTRDEEAAGGPEAPERLA